MLDSPGNSSAGISGTFFHAPPPESPELSAVAPPAVFPADAELRHGNYGVVRRLVRVLEGGAASKRRLDELIDRAGRTFNLREAILVYRNAVLAAKSPEGGSSRTDDERDGLDEKHAANAMARGAECLERYCMLLAFANWLDRGGLTTGSRNFAPAGRACSENKRALLRSAP